MNNILEIKNLNYWVRLSSSDSNKKEILRDITFDLERGKILGIIGESGSGKTSLAKIISGIINPSSGEIKINISNNWKPEKINPVQILFQNSVDIVNPLRKIESVIDEVLKISRKNSSNNHQKENLFDLVNFRDELRSRRGYELSGGERQRAALARIIAVNPELIILDEPFSAQDPESQRNFLNIFKKLNKEKGISIICIAHNFKLIRDLCEELIILNNGKIIEKGKTKEIFNSPSHPFTKFILKADDYNLTKEELFYNTSISGNSQNYKSFSA
jgi:ABC-type dipeptide/oligopeptide/nickel transport system ATPase subunit